MHMAGPAPPSLAIDTQGLARYLSERLEGDWSGMQIEQFIGGQSNPTYLLTAGDHRYVLRKRPHGRLLPSAHAIDREDRVMDALRGAAVPVAREPAVCTGT